VAAFDKVILREAPGTKKRSFVTAAILHASVACLLVLSSLIAVEKIQDPHADITLSFFALPEAPKIDPPKPKRQYQVAEQREPEPKPVPEPKRLEPERLRFKAELPEIEIPKTREQQQKMELAADRLTRIGGMLETPEPSAAVGTTRGPKRPDAGLASANLRAGAPLAATMDAPEVKIPGGGRGGPGLPAREPGFQVRAGGSGSTIKAYASASGPTGVDFAIPAPSGQRGVRGGKPGGGAPGLITVQGNGVGGGSGSGGSGTLKYGPGAAPGGEVGAFGMSGRPGGRGGSGTRLDQVRTALSQRYGLPLVSVGDLGQRSTEAARWNMLVPQISDMLRKVLSHRIAGGAQGSIASVQSDGSSLVIRYTDGIIHVLVPTEDGLAALFVARNAGARPVVSKVQEAESALEALARLSRGAS
jgi:hypothetical protein